jgi:nicotinamidase-related amidase
MDVLLVVDMQVGLLNNAPKHELTGVVGRINALAAAIRSKAGKVIWIQHCGRPGEDFERDTPGFELLPDLQRAPGDLTSHKTLNDPFAGTGLAETLRKLVPDKVLVTGWATDFCVDATVRSAVSHDFDVVVVGDGHTVSDREHLDAASVMRHHNWVWSNLITNRSIRVASAAEVLADLAA